MNTADARTRAENSRRMPPTILSYACSGQYPPLRCSRKHDLVELVDTGDLRHVVGTSQVIETGRDGQKCEVGQSERVV